MKKVITAMLLSAAILGFQACQDEGKDTKDDKKVAEEHNDAKFDAAAKRDAQFATDAYAASLFEIRAADSALKYAVTEETKKLAEKLRDQHKKSNDQLRALAAKKTITLPSDLTNDQVKKIEDLVSKKDMKDNKDQNFDKEYASLMVERHKDAIDLFDKASKDCSDKDLKDWFTLTLPDMRQHLDLAMNTEKDLPLSKKK
jgi:putative membrane protein